MFQTYKNPLFTRYIQNLLHQHVKGAILGNHGVYNEIREVINS